MAGLEQKLAATLEEACKAAVGVGNHVGVGDPEPASSESDRASWGAGEVGGCSSSPVGVLAWLIGSVVSRCYDTALRDSGDWS